MTPFPGFDSAFGPSPAAARQAKDAGTEWWAGYGRSPGAYHAWTPAEWDVLRQTGLTPGYLWVPTMGLVEDPTQAAAYAAHDATGLGLFGSVWLDTEYGMRGPRLAAWVDAFCAGIQAAGRVPAVYAGGGYVPTGVAGFWPYWGSAHNPASGEAVQYGPATRFATSVDVDLADPAFPFASFTPAPIPDPPKPPPPAPKPPPQPLEEDMLAAVVTPDGKVKVYAPGAGSRAGHLLEFTRDPANSNYNSVIDVTDQLNNEAPGSNYVVEP